MQLALPLSLRIMQKQTGEQTWVTQQERPVDGNRAC